MRNGTYHQEGKKAGVEANRRSENRPRFRTLTATFCEGVLAILLVGCNPSGETPDNGKAMKSGPIVYVALGDSTGAGVGAREGGYVVRLFNRILGPRPDSQLTNLCVSGATTADVLRDQLKQGVAMDPDLVTLGIGINDIGHGLTLEQFSTNYEEILSTLRQKTRSEIVVTNIPDISSAPRIPQMVRSEYQQQIVRFNERLEEIATRHGARVFDIYAVTHKQLPAHPEYFSGDGFHPSDEGYELWAVEMWPAIARVIGASP